MTELLVLLSHGHAGRPDAPLMLGAVVDGYTERDLIPLYTRSLEVTLRGHGVPCWTLSDGTLADRQARAVSYGEAWLEDHPRGRVFYLPCHVDAHLDASPRSLWMHDHRSRSGAVLARSIADAVGAAGIPGLGRQVVRAATPDPDWIGPWRVQEHIFDGPSRMCSTLAEPIILPAHIPHITPGWMSMIGAAMARGILTATKTLG